MHTLEVPANITWPSPDRRTPSGYFVWCRHLATNVPGSLRTYAPESGRSSTFADAAKGEGPFRRTQDRQ